MMRRSLVRSGSFITRFDASFIDSRCGGIGAPAHSPATALPRALVEVASRVHHVEQDESWTFRRPSTCFPRLDEFGADIQVPREHRR